MKVKETFIEGLLVIEPRVFEDSRGFFMETYQKERYSSFGFDRPFVQDNLSYSRGGVLRGLHYQIRYPQAKLVQVITGEVFDVAVDIRPGSPTFGKWVGEYLTGDNRRQFYIPEGFAHGFCVMSDTAHFIYKCSDYYNPADEGGILWSDPDIAVEWPLDQPLLSEKDKTYSRLKELAQDQLPSSGGFN